MEILHPKVAAFWDEQWLFLSWDWPKFCILHMQTPWHWKEASREKSHGVWRVQHIFALQRRHVKNKRMKRDVLQGRNFSGILWLPTHTIKMNPRKGTGFVLALIPLGKRTLAVLSVSPHQIHKLNLWSSLGIFFFNSSDGLAFSGWMTFLFQSRQLRRVWETWLDQALRKCFH